MPNLKKKNRKNDPIKRSIIVANERQRRSRPVVAIKVALLVGVLLIATLGFAAVGWWTNETKLETALAPPPLSSPQYAANAPAKEYFYAGSKLLAVSEPENPAPADLAVWRPSSGVWWVLGGPGSAHVSFEWGNQSVGDEAVPGDYS